MDVPTHRQNVTDGKNSLNPLMMGAVETNHVKPPSHAVPQYRPNQQVERGSIHIPGVASLGRAKWKTRHRDLFLALPCRYTRDQNPEPAPSQISQLPLRGSASLLWARGVKLRA